MASTMQVLLVHNFRRAPYGGGKIWSGVQEVLTAFLDSSDAQHPLLELLGESIARDHGLEEIEGPRPLILQMLLLPLGSKVQTRRWWTHYDGQRPWQDLALDVVGVHGLVLRRGQRPVRDCDAHYRGPCRGRGQYRGQPPVLCAGARDLDE